MLVFLVPDERRVDDLLQTSADHLAWKSVADDASALNLSPQQEAQAVTRSDAAKIAVDAGLSETYQLLLVPRLDSPTDTVTWQEVKADGAGDLVERAGRKLVDAGGLYVEYPPVLLRLHLDGDLASLWEPGAVTAGALWDACARYLYLHRLRDSQVLFACVSTGPASTLWAEEGFAVAETADPRTPGRYAALVAGAIAAGVRESTLVVSPDAANAQMAAELAANDVAAGEHADAEDEAWDSGTGPHPSGGPATPAPPVRLRRFYAEASLDPARLARDAGRLAEEVVAHLNAIDGTEVEITIEVRATNPAGFDDSLRKLVTENADALRLRQHGFERD